MKATDAITSLLRLAFSTLVEDVWRPFVEAPGGPNRVVFVTQMFPPEKGGNASRIHDTATSLQAGSWDVTVLAPPPTIPAGEFDRSWQRIRSETVDGVRHPRHVLATPEPPYVRCRRDVIPADLYWGTRRGGGSVRQAHDRRRS
jgi:hypothetical protein